MVRVEAQKNSPRLLWEKEKRNQMELRFQVTSQVKAGLGGAAALEALDG
jgi:hypothetical protein